MTEMKIRTLWNCLPSVKHQTRYKPVSGWRLYNSHGALSHSFYDTHAAGKFGTGTLEPSLSPPYLLGSTVAGMCFSSSFVSASLCTKCTYRTAGRSPVTTNREQKMQACGMLRGEAIQPHGIPHKGEPNRDCSHAIRHTTPSLLELRHDSRGAGRAMPRPGWHAI